MGPSSPLDTLPSAVSKPLEDIANELSNNTESSTVEEPTKTSQPEVASSSPLREEESSNDEGPESCLPTSTKPKATNVRPKQPSNTKSPDAKPKSDSRPKSEHRICPFCKQWPIVGGYEFCSPECETAAGIAKRKVIFRILKPLESKDRVAQAIYYKFFEEWADPTNAQGKPTVQAIYNISLPYYEDRFLDAVFKAQVHGGSNTRSAYFACQCICDVGVKTDDLCNSRSCGICMVIKNGFDELAFGQTTNRGIYGDGIYAHLNPAMAHRFTVRKADHDSRVIILCSIVELEPSVTINNILDYGAAIDGTGRVFCGRKDVIVPRRLVVYSTPNSQGDKMHLSVG